MHRVVRNGAHALDGFDEYLVVEQPILHAELVGADAFLAGFGRLRSV